MKVREAKENYEKEEECDSDCTCAHEDGVCAHDCMHCKEEEE